MYVPIHTYTHMRSVYRHTTRDVRGTATKSNGHGHTNGSVSSDGATHIHIHKNACTEKKNDRWSRKKNDKDKPSSQTFINWSPVWDHNGNNTRREREVATLRGGVRWVAVGGNRRSRQLRCQAANKKEICINILKRARAKPPIGCEYECVL